MPTEKGVRPLFLDALCAIVDVDVAARAGSTPLDLTRAFLDGGVRFLQLRAKQLPGAVFLDTAAAIVELARPTGAIVIVNDRADIARLSGAAGVHVGQDDLTPRAVRTIVGPDAVVGFSTHTVGQLEWAVAEPVSYIAIGPVFETSTKETGYAAVGLKGVADAARLASQRGLPVVAIGGITVENAAPVIEAGAASVAVISALLAGDPKVQAQAFLNRLRNR